MKKNKKATSMPMWLIIGFIIAIVVGAILIFLITDKSDNFSDGTNSCEYGGGECVPLSQCKGVRIDFICSEANQYCCIN